MVLGSFYLVIFCTIVWGLFLSLFNRENVLRKILRSLSGLWNWNSLVCFLGPSYMPHRIVAKLALNLYKNIIIFLFLGKKFQPEKSEQKHCQFCAAYPTLCVKWPRQTNQVPNKILHKPPRIILAKIRIPLMMFIHRPALVSQVRIVVKVSERISLCVEARKVEIVFSGLLDEFLLRFRHNFFVGVVFSSAGHGIQKLPCCLSSQRVNPGPKINSIKGSGGKINTCLTGRYQWESLY